MKVKTTIKAGVVITPDPEPRPDEPVKAGFGGRLTVSLEAQA